MQFSTDNSAGLGYVTVFNNVPEYVVRGGSYGSGQIAGVFGAMVEEAMPSTVAGFRCVKPTN